MKTSILKISLVVISFSAIIVGCGIFKKLLDPNIQKFNEDYNIYKSELESLDSDL